MVITSHFHYNHIGYLRPFTGAQVVSGQAEYDYWFGKWRKDELGGEFTHRRAPGGGEAGRRTCTGRTASPPGSGPGQCGSNAYRVIAPSVPFGGYGLSGLGRENGAAAIEEYTENKSVWVELTGGARDPFTLG